MGAGMDGPAAPSSAARESAARLGEARQPAGVSVIDCHVINLQTQLKTNSQGPRVTPPKQIVTPRHRRVTLSRSPNSLLSDTVSHAALGLGYAG